MFCQVLIGINDVWILNLYVLMAIVQKTMMKHGFLPQQFMTTKRVRILENKNGDIVSESNFRPIVSFTVAFKILIDKELALKAYQFYKEEISCGMGIMIKVRNFLKEIAFMFVLFIHIHFKSHEGMHL